MDQVLVVASNSTERPICPEETRIVPVPWQCCQNKWESDSFPDTDWGVIYVRSSSLHKFLRGPYQLFLPEAFANFFV